MLKYSVIWDAALVTALCFAWAELTDGCAFRRNWLRYFGLVCKYFFFLFLFKTIRYRDQLAACFLLALAAALEFLCGIAERLNNFFRVHSDTEPERLK